MTTILHLTIQGVWPLLIESALILLQTVPTHIEVDKLKMRLLDNTDGVLAVHEFHVWQVIHSNILSTTYSDFNCHHSSLLKKNVINGKGCTPVNQYEFLLDSLLEIV